MANIMDMVKTRIKTSRNGFDLSKKNAFTAKVGELLPVYCKEIIAGDKFEINVQAFTRTMPVNTAAYTRIRQYFDFYFVPTNLLWNRFHSFITSMGNNNQQADSIVLSNKIRDQHPYFTVYQIQNYLADQVGTNMFGYNRSELSRKLLDLLNYGDYYSVDDQFPARVNAALNPFPLLAYQKIYSDYFRNSQWEDSYAPSFNVNYITGNDDTNLPLSTLTDEDNIHHDNMFDLRYANWNKDYFMGLLPNSQYGDVASVSTLDENPNVNIYAKEFAAGQSSTVYANGATGVLYNSTGSTSSNRVFTLKSADGSSLSSEFSILALRMAEAKQRWAEVVQSNRQDVRSQMNAQFGVNVSSAYSEMCRYLGGSVSTLDINEVINQNLIGLNEAEVRGKGVGVHNGKIEFTSDVPGYVMCIYHAVPLLDYAISGISRQNLKTMRMDYAQPAFDKLGMVSVPLVELTNSKIEQVDYDDDVLLGYAPRYIDYKTDIDEVHGAFKHGGMDAWVAPVSDNYITTYLANLPSNSTIHPLTYSFFKVNPAFLNPIFLQDVDSGLESDQLLINSAFDVKAVRNLDVNGLPY